MNQTNLIYLSSILLNRKYRWYFHILFWSFVFLGSLIEFFQSPNFNPINILFISGLTEILITYFNIYFLYKRYLINGNIYLYIIFTLLTILIYLIINYYTFINAEHSIIGEEIIGFSQIGVPSFIDELEFQNQQFYNLPFSIIFADELFRIVSILGVAIGINFFKQYLVESKKNYEIKKNSLENELQYLKNQINPHFLFNSLNNIYINSKLKNKNTPDSILLLSDLLRYQLYECSKDSVLLIYEIDYIKKFIKLESLRQKNILIDINTDNINDEQVAPFIFMPFIENAIKFSSQTEKPFINLKIVVNDISICFEVENNKLDLIFNKNNKGIGIKNVKRRLSLLYPNSHDLSINKTLNNYKVKLTILI